MKLHGFNNLLFPPFSIVCLCITSLFIPFEPAVGQDAETIKIGNGDLREQVRKRANKEKEEITRSDLKKIKILRFVTPEQMKFLRLFPNLRTLSLSGNVQDLAPLKHLEKLETLKINPWRMPMNPEDKSEDKKTLEMVQPISQLSELKVIRIYDWSLPALPSGFLEGSDLKIIALEKTGLTDISFLKHQKKLETLDLSENEIQDLNPLSHLRSLQWLELDNNRISDLSSLQDMKNLQRLVLAQNRIRDISPIRSIPGLKRLDLSHNRIIELPDMSGLSPLHTLRLEDNNIENVMKLGGLSMVQNLHIDWSSIKDFPELLDTLRIHELTFYAPKGKYKNFEKMLKEKQKKGHTLLNKAKKKKIHKVASEYVRRKEE